MNTTIDENLYPYSADYESRNQGAVYKRVREIKQILESYMRVKQVENKDELTIGDTLIVAKEITEKYFEIVFQFKPFVVSKDNKVESKINIYKVISGLELAICEIKPIYTKGNENQTTVNAQFAFYVGFSFLIGFHKEEFLNFNFPNLDAREEKELTMLIKEHIDWLCMLQGNFHLPLFPNAHTWWALKLLLNELNEARI